MTDQELQILAKAAEVRKRHLNLTTLDLFILGTVEACGPTGLPLAFVRTKPKLFGTMSAFKPSTERLVAGGYIVKDIEPYLASDYKGKKGREPRREVVFKIKPLEYVL